MTKEKKPKSMMRRILLLLGPVVVLTIGGFMYVTGGRYIHTDNAYVKADKIMIAPDISGTITSVSVDDNQPVKKGDVLFTIDDAPYKIALQKSEADLVAAETRIAELKAQYRQKTEDLKMAQSDIGLAQKNYNRQAALRKSEYASQARVDDVTHTLDNAKQKIVVIQQEQAEILASLNGDADIATADHPIYKAAQAQLDKAKLDLTHTIVYAPSDAIAGSAPQIGDYARASVPVLNLVGSNRVWIEANYKETDLTSVIVGQPVSIEIDTYPGVEWTGKVESISPATGSEFSVLPAQNATGNWVKVVQRISVRISIDQSEHAQALRSGMSALTQIDTGSYPHMPTAWAHNISGSSK